MTVQSLNINNCICSKLLTVMYCSHTHTHTHAHICSELCAACGDEDESPFPQHRPSLQDSEASEHAGWSETLAQRDNDQQWITSQLETWER